MFTDERSDLVSGYRPLAPPATSRAGDEILAALAHVVGTEPGPVNPRAAYRTAAPGLAPIAALRRAIEGHAAHFRALNLHEADVVAEITRLVRHALPADTPDWSAYLLQEEIERWVAGVYAELP